MTLRFVPLSSLALTTALVAFVACKPAIIASGTGGSGGGGGSSGAGLGDGGVCLYNGVSYAAGASIPASDGCNTCACDPSGAVVCTAVECVPDSGPGDTCLYAGVTYPVGQPFPEGDGCNTCTCAANGSVSCTTIVCGVDGGTCSYAGMTYSVGEPFPEGDGCNTCTCASNGGVACTTIACSIDGGPTTDGGEDCVYNGTLWAEGESFPAGDGCNTCTCEAHATVHCTVNPCVFDGGPPPITDGGPGCFYEGIQWASGQSFPPAGDDCNTCTCQPDGNVICTGTTCDAGPPPIEDGGSPPPTDGGGGGPVPVQCFYSGQLYYPGEAFPSIDGCNTCACTDSGTVLCTTYTCDGG